MMNDMEETFFCVGKNHLDVAGRGSSLPQAYKNMIEASNEVAEISDCYFFVGKQIVIEIKIKDEEIK